MKKTNKLEEEGIRKIVSGEIDPKMIEQINKKMTAFMALKVEDLLAIFELANAIYSGATAIITNNQVLLNCRDKMQERVKNLKIMTHEEANKLYPKDKKKAELPGYLG